MRPWPHQRLRLLAEIVDIDISWEFLRTLLTSHAQFWIGLLDASWWHEGYYLSHQQSVDE
jgi:hypothetical protein